MHKPLITLTLLLALTACSDDEERADAYVQELAELTTDAAGSGRSLTLDNGEVLTLSNPPGSLKADTAYRVQAVYVKTGRQARLASCTAVLSPYAATYPEEKVVRDAVGVTACWKGGHYVNLRLAIKGSNASTHYFGFHHAGNKANAAGGQTVSILFLHDQNDDPLYYTREAYLSLPLHPFEETLTGDCDSVSLSLPTFEGERTFSFPL